MRCAEAWALLTDLDAGRELGGDATEALIGLGLAARAKRPAGSEGVAILRDSLREVRGRIEALRAGLRGADPQAVAVARAAIAAAEIEEKELRSSILELAELPADGSSHVTLTFRGRDLLGEVSSRLQRVGEVEVGVFLAEMDALRGTLAAAAERARGLLAKLSLGLLHLDEIDLRSAAVGLSASPMDVGELERRFVAAEARLHRSVTARRVLLLEAATMWPGGAADVEALLQRTRARIPDASDAAAAAAAAFAEGAQADGIIDEGLRLARAWGPGEVAPAVMIAEAGYPERAGRFAAMRAVVGAVEPDAASARWAAALLCLAPCDEEVAGRRFGELRAWLARFGSDGLSGPAAMLTLLDAEPPELLDDLRLAAAAIREKQLAISALETLALGIKLLLQVSLVAHPRLPGFASAGAALPVARLAPAFRQATILTYHAATVHRRVLIDDWDHPTHPNRVYG